MVFQAQLERGERTERVDFVFDEMSGLLEECIQFYEAARSIFPPASRAIAGSIVAGNDNVVVALQAADLLAGQATLNLRLGRPDTYWAKMATAHPIYQTTAYLPQFETVSELVNQVDTYWTALQSVRGLKDKVITDEESKALKDLLSKTLGNRRAEEPIKGTGRSGP